MSDNALCYARIDSFGRTLDQLGARPIMIAPRTRWSRATRLRRRRQVAGDPARRSTRAAPLVVGSGATASGHAGSRPTRSRPTAVAVKSSQEEPPRDGREV
jgi:hypothetical protein